MMLGLFYFLKKVNEFFFTAFEHFELIVFGDLNLMMVKISDECGITSGTDGIQLVCMDIMATCCQKQDDACNSSSES